MALKIGQLGKATGTNTETIRYYERIGLLPKAGRTDGNYRNYDVRDVERLTFIRHARGLGFEIADIRSLLELSESRTKIAVRPTGSQASNLRPSNERLGSSLSYRPSSSA